MSYNGYTNYLTWLVNLWINNDYYIYSKTRQFFDSDEDTETRADELKEFIEEYLTDHIEINDDNDTFIDDFITGALEEVNFFEIVSK